MRDVRKGIWRGRGREGDKGRRDEKRRGRGREAEEGEREGS